MFKVNAINKTTGETVSTGPWFFRVSEVDELVDFIKAWQTSYTITICIQDA